MNTVTTKPTAEAIAKARDYIVNAIAKREVSELVKNRTDIGHLMTLLINGCTGYKNLSNQHLAQCAAELPGGDDVLGNALDVLCQVTEDLPALP